jgi:hypothetical protein
LKKKTKKENNKLEENKWMIVKKEKTTNKIKNYFKNIFSKILNNAKNKNRKKVQIQQKNEYFVQDRDIARDRTNEYQRNNKKEITIEVIEQKKRPKEITIEYEARKSNKRKPIVVEYEQTSINNTSKQEKMKNQKSKKTIQVEVKQKKIHEIPEKIEPEERKNVEEMALRPVRAKKEKKPFNIFQLFKEKERKKRKEILNRVRENKTDDYETISTKTKLSKGSIAVEDVATNELDPLIDLYRDSNAKLRNRIIKSQQ